MGCIISIAWTVIVKPGLKVVIDAPATAGSGHSVLPAPPTDPTLGNTFIDPQDKFWSLYLSDAEKYDKLRMESWKGDTDGILIFTGLFAATVATFVVASYDLLSPNSNDETVILLKQLVSLSNDTQPQPMSESTFAPPVSAIWINSLWFGSLFVALSCALAATLVQQWIRRYGHDVQRRGPPRIRGPIHVFLSMGVRRFGMDHAVASIVTLLHLAVWLFFGGLVIYMSAANNIMAYVVVGGMGAGALCYLFLSILPLVCPDSPYTTPFTPLLRLVLALACTLTATMYTLAASAVALAHSVIDWDDLEDRSKHLNARASCVMHFVMRLYHARLDVACDIAQEPCFAREAYAFRHTLKNIDEVHELEAFYDALVPIVHPTEPSRLPPAARVPIVCFLLRDLRIIDGVLKLLRSRPSASHPLPQAVRNRRLIIGLTFVRALFKALPHGTHRPDLVTVLHDTTAPLYHTWVELGRNEKRPDTAFLARCFLATVRADVYMVCLEAAKARSDTLIPCRALALRLAQLDLESWGTGIDAPATFVFNDDAVRSAMLRNYYALMSDILELCWRGQSAILHSQMAVWLPMLLSVHQKAMRQLQSFDEPALDCLRPMLNTVALERRDSQGELVPVQDQAGHPAYTLQEEDRYYHVFVRYPEFYAALQELSGRINGHSPVRRSMFPYVPETGGFMSPWFL
ncbi:hypothetical protein PENSPDRAFT_689689 [Peniophora sp. CONT]|nr:hypothetical protein PENSPDRAFT_689689 [Peniophora sp. CONT]